MKDLLPYIEANKDRFLSELFELLSIPSVSIDANCRDAIYRCAKKFKDHLDKIGCDKTRVYETKGWPIVYGEKIVDANAPTVLVYGHYDVQPIDPIELWDSEPFNPVIKKTPIHPEHGAIFARGASDDKGQVFIHLKAVEYLIATDQLPCNVKFLIEGEEEAGSKSLETFLVEQKELLKNDCILISDTVIYANDQPTICTGLRGLSYLEVTVEGSFRDLHSGVYGGAVPNPINVLAKMIAQLHDDEGRVTIPGFYDDVAIVGEAERAEMNQLLFSEEDFKESIGIVDVQGEAGYNTSERIGIRPTLDVNGIWGGYTEEGTKTVIPAKAHAKISMRLVPGQDHHKIDQLFTDYFKAMAPKAVKVTVTPHHGAIPYVMPTHHKAYLAAKAAYEQTFKTTALPKREGGSIPIVALFEQVLGSKSALMGFGLDSDALHAPNENFGVYNFLKGIETVPYFYHFYSKEWV